MLAATAAPVRVHAQDKEQAAAPVDAETDEGVEDGGDIANEIIVTAANVRGQVDTTTPAIQELNEEDIAAYGAGSITDLIAALAPQTSSGRGRGGGPPALLINGVRVSSFREMASFPPEAIKKVEILPEEVAQKYGFPADARLINIILKDNFASRTVEAEYGQSWAGGTSEKELEGTILRISGPSRMNVHVDWEDTSPLTEAERDIVQSTPPPARAIRIRPITARWCPTVRASSSPETGPPASAKTAARCRSTALTSATRASASMASIRCNWWVTSIRSNAAASRTRCLSAARSTRRSATGSSTARSMRAIPTAAA